MKCPKCGSHNILVDIEVVVTFIIDDEEGEDGNIKGVHIPEDELMFLGQECIDLSGFRKHIKQYLCDDCGADNLFPGEDCILCSGGNVS
jgi:predicted nucleic-acid-binding Zn-ribbon protein